MNSLPDNLDQPAQPIAEVLRAGDRIFTGGQWEQIVADPIRSQNIVYVPTIRDGESRTRTFAAGERVTAQQADLRHPSWCVETDCFDFGGIAHHRSATYTINPQRPGDATLHVRLWQTIDEPIETAPVTAVLTVADEWVPWAPQLASYELEPWQIAQLTDVLIEVNGICGQHGDHPDRDAAPAKPVPPHEGHQLGNPGRRNGGTS